MFDDIAKSCGLGDVGRIPIGALLVVILAAMGGGGSPGAIFNFPVPVSSGDVLLLESGGADALLLESGGADALLLQF